MKNKSKTIIKYVVLFFALLILIFVLGFKNTFIKSSAEEQIDENFENMEEYYCDKLCYSSNPYDYIDNEFYDDIIAMGFEAIPILENKIRNHELNGCYTYVAAIAIEEISCIDSNALGINNWETADEFIVFWNDLIKNHSSNITTILNDSSLDSDEKIKQINAYGILAQPVLKTIANGDKYNGYAPSDEMKTSAKKLIEVSDSDCKKILQYTETK